MGQNGIPIRFFASTSNQVAPLNLYVPGTNSIHVLQPNEVLVVQSIAMQGDSGGEMYLFTSSTNVAAVPQNTLLFSAAAMPSNFATTGTWSDEDTGALSGTPGQIPFLYATTPGNGFVTGTGFIVTYPGSSTR